MPKSNTKSRTARLANSSNVHHGSSTWLERLTASDPTHTSNSAPVFCKHLTKVENPDFSLGKTNKNNNVTTK